ncbi:MAG: cation:dicarboxylase symporter family transporter [Spirochaetales bacterium]|jgi:Na+/H+-dicarboxylate symporter|nr:cation:dicarboxylase symporter family transporter [Spirochaetales bacterium]
MKIWIKLLIGAGVGCLLGFFLPADSQGVQDVFRLFSEITLRLGRFLIFPLVFFTLILGIYQLRENKKCLRVFLRIFVYMAIAGLGLTIIGAVSALFFSFRLPIIIEEGSPLPILSGADYLAALFPANLFEIFTAPGGNFLLPLGFLAALIGINLNFDHQTTHPVVQLCDALSRIFLRINGFLVEILGLGMIGLAAWGLIQLRMSPAIELFRPVFLVLTVDTALIFFGIFPLCLHFLIPGRPNPYRFIYALLAPALAAFFSGDDYFCLPVLIKNGPENLGIPRRVGALSYPLFALFGKAGTGLVTSLSFMVILRSYSSLQLSFTGVLWIILFAFLLSFLTGNYPALGFAAAIALMCRLYGRDIQDGYLILAPAIPLLMGFSVLLNAAVSQVVSLLAAEHERLRRDVPLREWT